MNPPGEKAHCQGLWLPQVKGRMETPIGEVGETWALEAVTPGADFIVSTADDPG